MLVPGWLLCFVILAHVSLDVASMQQDASAVEARYPSKSIANSNGIFYWSRDKLRSGNDSSRPYARWMERHSHVLSPLSLLNITLPGTHNSGAYALTRGIMPGSVPWPLDAVLELAEDAGLTVAEYIIHWSIAQRKTIDEQLEDGIRFLDMRTGYNGSTWVACHTAEGLPTQPMLQMVASFLEQNSKEVVVMELTHVYNNQSDTELELLRDDVTNTLGHLIAPCCRLNSTFEQLWEDGRRLVLVSSLPLRDRDSWWPPHMLRGSYIDSDSVETMWFYNQAITETFIPNENELFKLSWTLTPQVSTLVHGLIGDPSTLIDLADQANPLLPDFIDAIVEERLPYFPQIVVADDFEYSLIVPMVLHLLGMDPFLQGP